MAETSKCWREAKGSTLELAKGGHAVRRIPSHEITLRGLQSRYRHLIDILQLLKLQRQVRRSVDPP